jgi:hypothetical protein
MVPYHNPCGAQTKGVELFGSAAGICYWYCELAHLRRRAGCFVWSSGFEGFAGDPEPPWTGPAVATPCAVAPLEAAFPDALGDKGGRCPDGTITLTRAGDKLNWAWFGVPRGDVLVAYGTLTRKTGR